MIGSLSRQRLVVAVGILASGCFAPAFFAPVAASAAGYDVLPSGILRFKRNSGAQSCPPGQQLVCRNRTIMTPTPQFTRTCSGVLFETCKEVETIVTTPTTDVYCFCVH